MLAIVQWKFPKCSTGYFDLHLLNPGANKRKMNKTKTKKGAARSFLSPSQLHSRHVFFSFDPVLQDELVLRKLVVAPARAQRLQVVAVEEEEPQRPEQVAVR